MVINDIEKRLEALERDLKSPEKSGNEKKRRVTLRRNVATVSCLIAITLLVTLFLRKDNSIPLPQSVEKSATFPVYYPVTSLPAGYSYKQGSARLVGGVLFYNFNAGSKLLTVAEQTIPNDPPDLNSFPGFEKINSTAGNAIAGTDTVGEPAAIILSNTTLISITSTKDTPSDVVSALAKNMESIQE